MTARPALDIGPGPQAMPHGNAPAEEEAFAVPQALFRRNGFQILEDASLQMVDLVKALGFHIGGGLFAADASGAEHGDFAGALLIQDAAGFGLVLNPGGKFAERDSIGIDRALE